MIKDGITSKTFARAEKLKINGYAVF